MTDNSVYYKVVWTNTSSLTVAEMQWFDEIDYTMASNKQFDTKAEAIGYGASMAQLHNIKWDGPSITENTILDGS